MVTATIYKLLTLTWKKLVDPRVMIGDLTSLFETTCIRNTSAIDRLPLVQNSKWTFSTVHHALEVWAIEPGDEYLTIIVQLERS